MTISAKGFCRCTISWEAFLGEATSALDAGALDREVRALSGAIAEAGANSLPLESLEAFRVQHALGGGLTPWEEGYDMARRFRRGLGLDGEPLATIEQVADALGEDAELIEKAISPVEQLSGTPLIDGVVTRDDDERPAFAFRRLGEDSRRFHFCRSLAEVLTSPDSDSLITRARSERQQRNRAFAAEFLAPSSGLERMVSRPVVDGSDIDEMATEFGVSLARRRTSTQEPPDSRDLGRVIEGGSRQRIGFCPRRARRDAKGVE